MAVKNNLRKTQEFSESIIDTVREPLIILDQDLRVVTASRSFYEFFKVKPEETEGQLIYNLGNKQWDIPKLRELLETILPQQTTFDNYEVEHDFAAVGRRIMLLNARQIERALGKERIILLAIEDITGRKRLENLLTDSEERYRHLFETASDGIVFLEQSEGKITHANPAVEKMLGYTKREIIGNNLQDIGVSLDRGDFRTTIQNLNRSGIIHYNDVRVKTKSGQQMDTDIYLVDRTTLVQCSIRDVTERKRTEEKLRESEEKYRLVVDNMSDVIAIIDMNLCFTYISPSIMRLRGYTPEEATAQTFEQAMTPESLQIITHVLEEEMKLEAGGTADPGRSRILELQEYKKDGSIIWIENNLSFLRNETQKPLGIISLSRDITDRKRAEETLRESENKYRLLADNVSDVICVLDMNLNYTYVSPSIKILWGYEPSEVLKQKSFETLTPSSWELAVRTLSEVIELEKSEHRDINISRTLQLEEIRKDGTIVWAEVKFSFLRNENQQPVGILGVTRDITERKQAEETLRVSEEQYRLVVENAKESIIITQDMKVVFANRAAMDMVGYSKEILTLKFFTDFIHPDDLNMVADYHIRRIKGEAIPPVYSFRVISQDGTVIWCEINATVIQWKGKPATLNFLTNVTERKQAAEALRESEEQYRLVVENARESIMVTQDVDVKVVFANHAAIDMMGYSKEILSSKSFTDFIHPDDLDKVVDHHIKRLKGEEVPPVYSFRVIRRDGTVIWCEINAALIQWKGKPATLLFLNNVTERKQAEDELQQTLESLRKAVGATIQVMVSAVEMRDPYTAGHQLRVANLACAIAGEMGLSQEKMDGISMAGSIHDIGKLSIPAEILSKPTKLTNLEFSLIKEHAQSGYEMLKHVESPWPLAQIVYQHHERMNGSGYPRNLKGDEILMEARIMAVADVVESMASHRPYRAALGIDAALEEIEKNKGTLYDDAVADACLRLFRVKGYSLV